MQGLINQIPTKMTAKAAGKVENSPLASMLGGSQEAAAPAEAKGEFSSLFAGMVGKEASTENKVSGEKSPNGLDVLLSAKSDEQNKKIETAPLKAESALSPEVLKNINNLLNQQPGPVQANAMVNVEGKMAEAESASPKIARTTAGIEALLNNLKGTEDVSAQTEGVEEGQYIPEEQSPKQIKAEKNQSPLDFLLNKTKAPNVGMTSPEALLMTEETSDKVVNKKVALAGEDFVKNSETAKMPGEKTANAEVFNPQQMMQKNLHQTMKAYGQKQNILNDNVIRNTKDLASKDSKSKSAIDELRTPDLKVGAQLSAVKEDFIPIMQKPEQNQNQNLQTNTQAKVLDLSNINTSNTNEIIQKISDYIQQSQVANRDSLELTVKHDSLGQFNIQVSKAHGGNNQAMDMQIVTTTAEGHEFFAKHEIGLMKNLSQAGIQLSDLKIVSSGSESMNFSQNDRQSGQSQNNGQAPREFMSFDRGDSSGGSQRRRDLWEQAQQNVRYGA